MRRRAHTVTVLPGETVEVTFLLGEGGTRMPRAHSWRRTTRAAQRRPRFETVMDSGTRAWLPSKSRPRMRALNILTNRWLLYQTLSCRFYARSAFYQSGGAFGFRDQLQDVLAFLHFDAGIARNHIIRAAGRQFPEGDVQHWWHEPGGEGVRTRIQDDRLWLVYAALEYARVTGDWDIFDATRRSSRSAPRTRMSTASTRRPCACRGAVALRALHPRDRADAGDWASRAAVDRHRRLERRHG